MIKRIAVALLLVLIVTILGKSQSREPDQPILQQRVATLRPSSGKVSRKNQSPDRRTAQLIRRSSTRNSQQVGIIVKNSGIALVNL